MSESTMVRCELVFATPERQVLLSLTVPEGTTAIELVHQSPLAAEFPEVDFSAPPLGVFAQRVATDYIVQEGDRVEVYRPLTADPKDVRRALAASGLTMGKRDDEPLP
ncbi:MAG: RnfH family protein [Pseudomonadota bacterium]